MAGQHPEQYNHYIELRFEQAQIVATPRCEAKPDSWCRTKCSKKDCGRSDCTNINHKRVQLEECVACIWWDNPYVKNRVLSSDNNYLLETFGAIPEWAGNTFIWRIVEPIGE